MAIPFIIGAAAVVYGGKKTKDGLDKMEQAKKINEEAQEIADNATNSQEDTRVATNESLENLGKTKISIMSYNMRTFVDNFSQLQNVDFSNAVIVDELRDFDPQSYDFLEMKEASFNASELAEGGLSLALSDDGAVGAFATASTGAAISGLTGAAATNATLAWLGGGAIASGGGGIAAGTMVLGGLVAIPAIIVGGWFLSAKADKALSEAKTNYDKAQKYEQEVRNLCTAMEALKDKAEQIDYLLYELDNRFSDAISDMINTIDDAGIDFSTFSSDEEDDIIRAAQLAQTIKVVIDTPLMNQQGGVTAEAERLIESRQVLLDKLY